MTSPAAFPGLDAPGLTTADVERLTFEAALKTVVLHLTLSLERVAGVPMSHDESAPTGAELLHRVTDGSSTTIVAMLVDDLLTRLMPDAHLRQDVCQEVLHVTTDEINRRKFAHSEAVRAIIRAEKGTP